MALAAANLQPKGTFWQYQYWPNKNVKGQGAKSKPKPRESSLCQVIFFFGGEGLREGREVDVTTLLLIAERLVPLDRKLKTINCQLLYRKKAKKVQKGILFQFTMIWREKATENWFLQLFKKCRLEGPSSAKTVDHNEFMNLEPDEFWFI